MSMSTITPALFQRAQNNFTDLANNPSSQQAGMGLGEMELDPQMLYMIQQILEQRRQQSLIGQPGFVHQGMFQSGVTPGIPGNDPGGGGNGMGGGKFAQNIYGGGNLSSLPISIPWSR